MESLEALHLAELLCSRLCHDLSGPVGAAAAGAELIADSEGDKETLDLVATSATAASARLAFLRAAFGFGSQPQRVPVIRTLIDRYFGSLSQGTLSPLSLTWVSQEAELTGDVARLVLNMVITARDALPRGGVVSVETKRQDTKWSIQVTATGEKVKLVEEAADVLIKGANATGPRGAQALLLKILSTQMAIDLVIDQSATSLVLRLS